MPRAKRPSSSRRRVAVVTGTRAEFGLLVPVMDAIKKRKDLELLVVAAGAHFLPPARTIREVESKYPIAARVPMQKPGKSGRDADAQALGRGVEGFARAFKKLKLDWVVVLGDRIEAFAAASAASIAGIAVAHIHGGDRAEGIADEAMRHAITKLSHLHCAATKLSAERIRKMGEKPEHVHVTGSPAIDGLSKIRPMSDAEARKFGNPRCVVLLHPAGLTQEEESEWAFESVIMAREIMRPGRALTKDTIFQNILLLSPNHDPGYEVILAKWKYAHSLGAHWENHLPRSTFLSLLARLRHTRGALIGNSSAGLIEAAALRVPTLNVGQRQEGRERGANCIDIRNLGEEFSRQFRTFAALMDRGVSRSHPYGDGRAGSRIAALLAKTNPHDPALLRKRNSY